VTLAAAVKPEFHYADFPETSPSGEFFKEVGVMEFGLNGSFTSPLS